VPLIFPFVFSLDLSDEVLERAILVRSLLQFPSVCSPAEDFPPQLIKVSVYFAAELLVFPR
jgi:hypothetical protein